MRYALVGLMLCVAPLWSGAVAAATPVASVAGDWSFALDPTDAGVDGRWFANHTFTDAIALPGTTDLAGKGPLTTGGDPGHLTRVHKYYGPAWYQRTIDVPAGGAGRHVQLQLERVIWESRAWVDGNPAGSADSLDTPHFHDLGVLTPGSHTLTLRVDNRMIHPVGTDGHNFTEQTQTIWNGVVGKLELRAAPGARLVLVRAFPDAAGRQVRVEATVENGGAAIDLPLALNLTDDATHGDAGSTGVAGAPESRGEHGDGHAGLPADAEAVGRVRAEPVHVDGHAGGRCAKRAVGFRTLTRAGQHLAINGRTGRSSGGNMEHLIFPLTGAPPTDVASWRRVFQTYKDYGFNQMRCHSCTPPDAAFTAADQMGIYIQAETFWMQYALGSGKPMGAMKHEPAMPASFAFSDQSPDDYVRAELRRVEDAYGNHPSLVFVVIGNELGKSDWPVTGRWIAEEKAHDPRHWYAASTARQITPADDFNDTHAVPKVGWVRDRLEAFNDWDYDAPYAKAPVPIIAHELGQWPTYPRWSEFDAFTRRDGPPRLRGDEGDGRGAGDRGAG